MGLPLCSRLCGSYWLALVVMVLLAVYGPIEQYAHYHDFADQRVWLGIPYAADVLSNAGFVLVGVLGLVALWQRRGVALPGGRAGWLLVFGGIFLTGLGSAWYHLAPTDWTLVWDRLPIALACAGLLAALGVELHGRGRTLWPALWLSSWAISSVWWWYWGGDLRPYIMLQALPLVLLPLWCWQLRLPAGLQWRMGLASLGYVLAKLAEVYDHGVFGLTHGYLAGHTLKHVFATWACWLVYRFFCLHWPRPVRAPRGLAVGA